MKTTLGIVGGIVLSLFTATINAQTPTTTPTTAPTTTAPTNTTTTTTAPVSTWDYQKNATVDSIAAKYRDKILPAPAAMTTEQIFPVIGKYESATNTEASVITISLDEQNHGIAWIDGLPQGRIKALLRKSPAVYKIPAQKTEEGKEVAEGTLIFDKDLNTLSICLGKDFNNDDPASVFSAPVANEEPVVVKSKSSKTKIKKPAAPKAWIYTATKINANASTTSTVTPVNQ
jgi:hypothetical protein